MKIFFVNNAPLCSGAEEHLLDLGKWLKEHEVAPIFLVREESVLGKRAGKDGFKVYPVFANGLKKILSIFRIAKLIVVEKPDVISVNREHNIYPTFLAFMLVALVLRKKPKLVAVFHTPTGRSYPVLNKFDGIICTSHYTASSFIKANACIKDKTRIIHYGIKTWNVDVDAKANLDRKRKYFTDRKFPIIGMVGELWKNQEELIDVARDLVKTFPTITVALVGSGYDAKIEDIKRKIASLNLEDNFVLTGRVDRSMMPDIFHDFDLSVSTHRNEGFGIVHLESLAACTPVVAYNSGGLVEILNNGGGVLVEGGMEDFAKAVTKLLADDASRERLGMEGRKVVEHFFTIEQMASSHFNYYRRFADEQKENG